MIGCLHSPLKRVRIMNKNNWKKHKSSHITYNGSLLGEFYKVGCVGSVGNFYSSKWARELKTLVVSSLMAWSVLPKVDAVAVWYFSNIFYLVLVWSYVQLGLYLFWNLIAAALFASSNLLIFCWLISSTFCLLLWQVPITTYKIEI